MLEESEWQSISPLLENMTEKIKAYREQHECDLATANRFANLEAVIKHEQLTGFKDISAGVLFHHRLKDYGQECKKCGYLFRTPRSAFCANCGQTADENI